MSDALLARQQTGPKIKCENQERLWSITGMENRPMTVLPMSIITVIKTPKWLHSTLSLTALAAASNSYYLQ